jgi:predicted dehydrogenase
MDQHDPIRWGILSTGGIATRFTEDLALLPDAQVAAVASRTAPAAQEFAGRHDIPNAYGTWQALAEDPKVDVIYVATPHNAHFAATKLCLEAGKAVLCEKPFTLDLASSTELVAIARDRGVFLMEAMWMRANPAIRRIVELVGSGAIGEVTHVQADFGVQGGFPPGHRMRNPQLGGGALLDLGVYPVTFAYLFLGAPEAVTAWASLTDEGVDENTGIVLGYPDGAVATLHCGFVGSGAVRATITGTTGRIDVPTLFFRPDRFTLVRNGSGEEIVVPIRGNGLGYEAEEVMRCLRAGQTESSLIPLDDTLAVMRTLDNIREQIGVSYPVS